MERRSNSKIWKEAIVIPIQKPMKDPTKLKNYRPIALTSNLGKLMEKIIVNRINYGEKRKI